MNDPFEPYMPRTRKTSWPDVAYVPKFTIEETRDKLQEVIAQAPNHGKVRMEPAVLAALEYHLWNHLETAVGKSKRRRRDWLVATHAKLQQKIIDDVARQLST